MVSNAKIRILYGQKNGKCALIGNFAESVDNFYKLMTERGKLFTATLVSLLCLNGYSQRPCADISFDGLFDNREYKGDMIPQTIYGMRISPQMGIATDNHTLMAGFSKIWEFGSDEKIDPDIILYYKYQGKRWSTYFGAIPRQNLQRQLPDAFLYDSIAFFEPTIGGTVIQYNGNSLQTELYCNWFSRQADTVREAFRIVWDGYAGSKTIGGGWYMAMTHFAKPKQRGHYIYEKFMFNPYLSLDLSGKVAPELTLKANAGLLCSMVRCRKDGDWHTPAGFLGDIQLGWRMFDIKSTVYAGGSQQPFLDDTEAGMPFHRSDPFYNHTFYNRTELGVMFVADRNVEFGFRWNLHFTPDTPVHNQQLITVRYRLNTDHLPRIHR